MRFLLAGLVTKSSGKVRIWGFDQDENPRQSRAAIGIMPQEPNLDPFFTPRGSLEVQAGLYGVPKAQRRTDEILELVGLTDKAEAYARSLSGDSFFRLIGERSKVQQCSPYLISGNERIAFRPLFPSLRVRVNLPAWNSAIASTRARPSPDPD